MKWLINTLLSLLFVFLSYSTPLAADTRLFVPSFDDDKEQSIVEMLRTHFQRQPQISLITADEQQRVLNNIKTKQNDNAGKDAEEAKELLLKGWTAYRQLELDLAIEHLKKAQLIFRRTLPDTLDFKNLLTSYLHLGIAYLAKDKKEQGEDQIRRMIILDPARKTRKLSSKFYTPQVLQTYDTLRKQVLSQKTASINLKVNPQEALVRIDGAKIKGTLVRDLPVGEHFISVENPNSQNYFSSKSLAPGDSILNIALQPVMSASQERYYVPTKNPFSFSRERSDFLDYLTVQLNADMILLLSIDIGGVTETYNVQAQLYDQRNQQVSLVEKQSFKDLSEAQVKTQTLVTKLMLQLDNKGYVSQQAKSGEKSSLVTPDSIAQANIKQAEDNNKSQPRAGKPFYKQWWFYGALGAVAVGTGALFLFTDIGDSGPSSSTILIGNPSN